jgi:hypothetical protein
MAARSRRRQKTSSRGTAAKPARKTARTARRRSPNQGFPKGSKHPSAQLTIKQVRALRAGRYDDRPFAELAAKWGVSPAAVSLARTGRTWSWLPGARKPIKPTDPKRHRKAATRARSRTRR